MKKYKFKIIIEPCEEGGYFADCPDLQGCHAEGETYLEALENIQDVIRIHLESRAELGKLKLEKERLESTMDVFKIDLPIAYE